MEIKSLGQMGELLSRDCRKVYDFLCDIFCDDGISSKQNENIIGLIREYCRNVISLFGTDMRLLNLNPYQYFEFLKIAKIEYKDLALPK